MDLPLNTNLSPDDLRALKDFLRQPEMNLILTEMQIILNKKANEVTNYHLRENSSEKLLQLFSEYEGMRDFVQSFKLYLNRLKNAK